MSETPDVPPKLPEYPGWNLDLRWHDQMEDRSVTYPMGIHYNSRGAQSEMLLVREIAMMMVMDRLTDKPNWHIKVFDDEITEKWKTEALAWPNEDLWKRIANLSWELEGEEQWHPKTPKNILDKECVDHVSEPPLSRRRPLSYPPRSYYPPLPGHSGTPPQSQIL
jgi:hypothetical protein